MSRGRTLKQAGARRNPATAALSVQFDDLRKLLLRFGNVNCADRRSSGNC
jgi:hypothetical protein